MFGGYACEAALFWIDLGNGTGGASGANLIDFNFSGTYIDDTALTVAANVLGQYFPKGKLGGGNYITVYNDNEHNYFVLANILDVGAGQYDVPPAWTAPGSLSPYQLYSIDTKIDDGLPLTGRVITYYWFNAGGWCWGLDGYQGSAPCGNG
jgi:hypothetical protein